MKKIFLKAVILISTLSLTSCKFVNPFEKNSEVNDKENSLNKDLDLTNKLDAYTYGNDYYRKVLNDSSYMSPTTGEVKALIVPVAFKGQNYDNYGDENTIINNIDKAFFGNAISTNYWESVSSFYNKSSYQKMNITGEVTPIYTTKHQLNYYLELDAADASNEIGYEFYLTNKSNIDFSQYDSDKDGVVDLMWFVYLNDYLDNEDFLWAYTYWNSSLVDYYQKLSSSEKKDTYIFYNYSWASYEFLVKKDLLNKQIGIDAHTYIHETGHQLGLDDYYSYDDSPASPLGRLDMMDANILDHNSLSKYNLGWVTPIVGEANKTYTLKPFENNGDCLILASNFNGSCFDEYFLLEYYTPTGLNELDSNTRYENNYPYGFSKNGLKILHVDQRVGKFSYVKQGLNNTLAWDGKFYDEINVDYNANYFYRILNSNSLRSKYVSNRFNLIELVQASGRKNLVSTSSIANKNAENSDLFTDKSLVFGKDVSLPLDDNNSFITNEGWKIPFSVKISEMNDKGITFTLVEEKN